MVVFEKATIAMCLDIYEIICELENKILPYERFSEILKKQLDDKSYYCIVCKNEKEIMGVLNIRFEEQLHHSECIAEIMEFAVKSEYRGKGIGKQMLEYGNKIAKDYGCIQIEVACNQARENSHRFYLREKMHNTHYKFSKIL